MEMVTKQQVTCYFIIQTSSVQKIIVIVWINAVCKQNIFSRDMIFRSQGTTARRWRKGHLTLKQICVLDTELTKMFRDVQS